MKVNFFIPFLLLCKISLAQLNCKTSIDAENNTIKKCFHENGVISTLEKWDKNKQEGSIKVFDKNEKELFNYGLRTYAGHSSVYLKYYKNGQVSRAEYSSAPDGGIQFFNEISYFDENGKLTSFMDLSEPDGYPRLRLPNSPNTYITEKQKNEEKQQQQRKEEQKQQSKNSHYEKPYFCVYQIHNSSKSKVVLTITNTNQLSNYKTSTITLKSKQNFVIDTIHTAIKITDVNLFYKIEINSKTKKAHQLKLLQEQPKEDKYNQSITWYVFNR